MPTPRLIKLRARRRLRQGQKQVTGFSSQVEQGAEAHFVSRLKHLLAVRRFLAGWLGLLLVLVAGVVLQSLSLTNYYQTLRPVPGGIYNEGVQGQFTNANPLYATSEADATVSRLVFAGLLTTDGQGRLTGDLASDYSVDARGTSYTVHLRPHLTWQDGQPLTSSDVLFTYQLIQNPDAGSPLRGSWQGVTVTAPDARTVVFKLPDTLASFPSNLTTGIVPRHVLAKVPVVDLRSADFNTLRPVGAGPFAWQAIEVTGDGQPQHTKAEIALTPFAHYQGGRPKLQQLVVQVFAADTDLLRAFQTHQLTAMASASGEVPAGLRGDRGVVRHSLLLRAANMVFFKTSSGVLADPAVRQALVQAADVPAIVRRLDYQTPLVREPLLSGQLGYDPALVQPGFDLAAARQALDAAGWTAGAGGFRTKAGQPLAFTLLAADSAEDRLVTGQLQKQWRALGVRATVQLQSAGDFQAALTGHGYDAVLKGIAIGSDPDVFVYWDSSQADVRAASRLNLSEYNNPLADAALEAGRTRLDPGLRVIKYRPFLQAWQHDAPALGLYQPRLLYLTRGPVHGLTSQPINTATDRFASVQNWQIREARVTNP